MRKIEKNSSARAKARKLCETSDSSFREIAAAVNVDEKTVRNWKNADGWARKSAEIPQEETSLGGAAAAVVARLEMVTENGNIPLPADIARNTCIVVDALRAHIQTVVQNLHLVRELAEAETAGDESPARARLVDKVLSLPGLMKAVSDLTAAIARLADNSPGKKELAQEVAKDTAKGRFATPAPPKFTQGNVH
jgi:hypothetical protein